jgi:predicted transcriptional regulator
MRQKTIPKPTSPKDAREALGLRPLELAAKARCGQSLVYVCEASGRFPVQRATRAAYLKALSLTERQAAQIERAAK